ncbi:MBL fold metallo-hydrolase [Candidatus Giovannonibacteria bacterium]|nr:MBL fold metallo-hydrolase [Candidatus Giovannonibacteria bacterium]
MKKHFRYSFPLALAFIAVLLFYSLSYLSNNKLKFYILDVGQGDAIFIETPSKNQILVDGGPDKSVLKELGKVMPFYDRSIDVVILTHPNLDHLAGLVEVLKKYEVKTYIDAGDDYALSEYVELKNIIKERRINYIKGRRGMKIIADKEVGLLILMPEKLIESKNPNDNSIVAKLTYGDIDFLLMGDAEKNEELSLVLIGDNIESEVLKVGHHGSKTSSNPLFLEKVKPELALISVGKNSYGHPSKDILQNLAFSGASVFRTDVDLTILVETDGKSLTSNIKK